MTVDLDRELVGKIKGLRMEFKDEPQSELLIRIPNRNKDVDYEVEVETKEFTSLCPLNPSQPDYAKLTIIYSPDKWCVELKSLKFYLVSFRQVLVFHEEVPATILKYLVALLQPKYLQVEGVFTTRGGLDTTVLADYDREDPAGS